MRSESNTYRNGWLKEGHVEGKPKSQREEDSNDDDIQETSCDLQHHPHIDSNLGQLVQEHQEINPRKEHRHRPNLPLTTSRAKTVVFEHNHKSNGEAVENDLNVVCPVQPICPVHVDLVFKAAEVGVHALCPVDQLEHFENETGRSKDDGDDGRKV